MTVTALLVSHDGARWLPAVLEGLRSQSRRPDRVVAVDTGSTDASPEILAGEIGEDALIRVPSRTSFPDAIAQVLRRLPAGDRPGEPEWIWILHDDSRPAPDALEHLVRNASDHPSVGIVGPKVREWPSLRRLLEIGITMSGTGRRETWLERGEYDQGQHDRTREVLAVGSAGMLVRRDVLEELGGFDRRLPIFGNDLDLGWRAARAGHRTLVVPEAVVFHVEAAHRGLRRTRVTGSRGRNERRAALYTLLVNSSLLALPFVAVRLFLGSLLRALGLLLVRAPGESLDELVALAGTYARPDRVLLARLQRRRTATVPPREVRHLLAPFWLPYRHGLDFVSDLAMAVVHQAGDASAARRPRRISAESGPVPAEAQDLPEDTGLLARLLSSPAAAVLATVVLLSLVAARGLLGSGMLSGGALLPAPGSATYWWSRYLESWHADGVGSAVSAAPYLLPLAVLGTLLLGKAWLVVDLLFLLAVPLAAWGALRLFRALVGRGWPALWGAVAYGLAPAVAGAVAQGRLGTVAAAVLLPWVAHAALFLDPGRAPAARSRDADADRRWRAAWRTALLLALLTAFAPLAWPVAALLGLVAAGVGVARGRAPLGAWTQLAVSLLAVPVLLLPWSLLRVVDGGPGSWYAEAGLPAPELVADLGAWDLIAGRATSPDLGAAPLWFGVGIAAAAVAALFSRARRPVVLAAWVVILAGLATTALLDARGEWAGFGIVLAQGGAVAAAVVAGAGIATQLTGRNFGWHQPVGLLVVVGAVLAPLAGLVWWAAAGVAGPLERAPAHGVPPYMIDDAQRDPDHGVLVIRHHGAGGGLGYSLLRDEGARLGDDTVAAGPDAHESLTSVVGDLATAPTAATVEELSRHGVEFIYLPPPASPALVGNLDSVSGLSTASAVRPGSRAWQLDAEPTRAALPGPDDTLRPALLGLQGLAVVAALVLAAPSRRSRR